MSRVPWPAVDVPVDCAPSQLETDGYVAFVPKAAAKQAQAADCTAWTSAEAAVSF